MVASIYGIICINHRVSCCWEPDVSPPTDPGVLVLGGYQLLVFS